MKEALVPKAVVLVLVVLLLVAPLAFLAGCKSVTEEPTELIEDIEQNASSAVRDANLRMIDSAIDMYYAERQQWPTSMTQLMQYFGGKMPTDPAGGTYYIVMQNGEAKAAVK